MTARTARARVLLVCCAISLMAYAAASPTPGVQALAILLGAIGLLLTSPWIGLRFPRWVPGLAILGVLFYTLNTTLGRGLGVDQFAMFVTWMIVVKLFDRRHAGDDAQLLAYSIFLALAAVIVSNGLLVGVLTILYLPLLAYAAMHLQLRLGLSKAERLAGKGVPNGMAHGGIRAVAGAGAGISLRRTSLLAILMGLVVAAFVFVIVPRGAGLQQLSRLGGASAGRVVAFSDRVRVGSGGSISMSRKPVLHLSLHNVRGDVLGGEGAIQYLRGAALDQYADGVWFSSGSPDNLGARHDLQPEHPIALPTHGVATGGNEFQEITLLATPEGFTYLFTVWQPMVLTPHDTGELAYDGRTGTLMADINGGKFRYTVRSGTSKARVQDPDLRLRTTWDSPVVSSIAEHILQEAGIDPDPARRPADEDEQAILAFRRFFWDHYTYSLGEPPPPPGAEPIEWFLTQADRGHCEHFAAALAALCRSVGIPARVMTGYLAAEYNRTTESYIVRESNAHAWVEAQSRPGVWEKYDATPPGDLVSLHGPSPGLLARAGRLLDTLNYTWINSIVSFDSGTRSDLLALDSPRTQKLTEKAEQVLSAMRRASIVEIAVLAAKIFAGIVGTIVAVYLAVVLGRKWLALRARRPRALPRRIADAQASARVAANPIYQDMLVTLARAGIRKPDWQPPRAWSDSLTTKQAGIGGLMGELTEMYYVIRFGGRELDDGQLTRAREILDVIRSEVAGGA